MRKIFILLFLPILSFAQNEGLWRLEVASNFGKIPVHISLEKDGYYNTAYAVNAKEKLAFDRIYYKSDTVFMHIDLYDLLLVAKVQKNKMTGYISKRLGSDMLIRQVDFVGTKADSTRFKGKPAAVSLGKKYKIEITSLTSGKTSPAVGVFEVNKGKATGTILTSTGDHRYLQGNVIGDSLYLSALGLNAYLYKAKIKGDSLIGGEILHPFAKTSTFKGVKDDNFTLPDASKLTYLKEGQKRFNFSFNNIQGKTVSLADPEFKNQVTVVQILGTWCPNCLDETKFLMDYIKSNPNLKVIGLAFERNTKPDYVNPKIERFIERFKVDYPILLAGTIEEAASKLPQLNHVMSFPTTIIVDKKGTVRKIHTGFSGPGTGKYFEDYTKEFSEFIESLQAE